MYNFDEFDPTDANAAIKAAELANKYEKALRRIVNFLGSGPLPDVDYGDLGNLAGLSAEIDAALLAAEAVGIKRESCKGVSNGEIYRRRPR